MQIFIGRKNTDKVSFCQTDGNEQYASLKPQYYIDIRRYEEYY